MELMVLSAAGALIPGSTLACKKEEGERQIRISSAGHRGYTRVCGASQWGQLFSIIDISTN
jgi:hypothetical protein